MSLKQQVALQKLHKRFIKYFLVLTWSVNEFNSYLLTTDIDGVSKQQAAL